MSQGSGLVQCEVTGNWVPEDEVVTFQGKRVGAEGKSILLERLRSGSDAPGTLVAPSVWARFGGLFVDGFLGTVVAGIVAIPIAFLMFIPSRPDQPGETISPQFTGEFVQMFFQAALGVFLIGYFTFFHYRTGQTVGKKLARTKVVDLDGRPISGRVAFLRALYYYLPNFLTSLAGIALVLIQMSLPDGASEGASPGVATLAIAVIAISAFSGIYGLADMLVALFDRSQQRAIHDRLAGTRVIRV